jgi:hypothetical protein
MRPALVFTIKSDALGPFPKANKPSLFSAALVRSLSEPTRSESRCQGLGMRERGWIAARKEALPKAGDECNTQIAVWQTL